LRRISIQIPQDGLIAANLHLGGTIDNDLNRTLPAIRRAATHHGGSTLKLLRAPIHGKCCEYS